MSAGLPLRVGLEVTGIAPLCAQVGESLGNRVDLEGERVFEERVSDGHFGSWGQGGLRDRLHRGDGSRGLERGPLREGLMPGRRRILLALQSHDGSGRDGTHSQESTKDGPPHEFGQSSSRMLMSLPQADRLCSFACLFLSFLPNFGESQESCSIFDPRCLEHLFFQETPFSTYSCSNSMDLVEHKDHFIITMNVPGFDKKEITLFSDNGQLNIEGKKAQDTVKKDQEGGKVLWQERSASHFKRSFTLPKTADTKNIKAKLNQGVLTITLGKKPDVTPPPIVIE